MSPIIAAGQTFKPVTDRVVRKYAVLDSFRAQEIRDYEIIEAGEILSLSDARYNALSDYQKGCLEPAVSVSKAAKLESLGDAILAELLA